MFKTNILLIDDDAQLRGILHEFLSLHDYNVYNFDNGQAALHHINTTQDTIDLVLSDICMPILDGIQLAQEMKRSGQNIPIVFMTGYASTEQMKIALQLGVATLNKPLNFQKLTALINNLTLQNSM